MSLFGGKPGAAVAEDAAPAKGAVPPACPRCEVVKAQVRGHERSCHPAEAGCCCVHHNFAGPRTHARTHTHTLFFCLQCTRTVMNYQKAHRKKIDALRTELRASRSQTEQLQMQVRRLRSIVRIHLPSVAVGAALGLVGQRLWKLFQDRKRKPRASSSGAGDAAAAAVQAAA